MTGVKVTKRLTFPKEKCGLLKKKMEFWERADSLGFSDGSTLVPWHLIRP
jgi:hypothetical protein